MFNDFPRPYTQLVNWIMFTGTCIFIHLSWDRLTADTEQSALPRCEEVHWAWLKGVRWEVDLLRKLEAVVSFGGISSGSSGVWQTASSTARHGIPDSSDSHS